MTSFREYRAAMDAGAVPQHEVPSLPKEAIDFQGERAGFVSRLIAVCVDVLLIFLIVLGTIAVLWMLSYIVDPTSSGSLISGSEDRVPKTLVMVAYGYFLNWVYWTVCWATSGRTLGNLLMGLRVVNYRGTHQRWGGALLRSTFCMVFPFGLLWVIFSRANRSLQDTVLRTSVIYDWVVRIPGFGPKVGIPEVKD
jgi:uncharacterized RDD family membrane protein YckC